MQNHQLPRDFHLLLKIIYLVFIGLCSSAFGQTAIAPDQDQCYSLARLEVLKLQPSFNNGLAACCADCTPGTCPCQSGGTGTWAVLQLGDWYCTSCNVTATTTTTTTSGPTTTVTIFSNGYIYQAEWAIGNSDTYGTNGIHNTVPLGTPVLIPSTGRIQRFRCYDTSLSPDNSNFWNVCVSISNSPFDEFNFGDTPMCLQLKSFTNSSSNLALSSSNPLAAEGRLVTFHGFPTGLPGFTIMRCAIAITAP